MEQTGLGVDTAKRKNYDTVVNDHLRKEGHNEELQQSDSTAGNTERADEDSEDGSQKSSSTVSVVDLLYSMFEDFTKVQTKESLEGLENTRDREQILQSIVCRKLGFPVGSVLKCTFNSSSFRIDIVENVIKDNVKKKCKLKNLTVEYALEENNGLKGLGLQRRSEQLCKILCMKAEVAEELVDEYTLERKVREKENLLKKLKQNKQLKRHETVLKSVFYLPSKRQDLLKDLQETHGNCDFHFLQNQNTEITNGLVLDVFEALKGNLTEIRKVLCSRFTKCVHVKVISFNEHVTEVVKKVENLKEANKSEELKKFLNLSFFEANYPNKASSLTRIKETEKENKKVGIKKIVKKNENTHKSKPQPDSTLVAHIKKEPVDVNETDDHSLLSTSNSQCFNQSSDEDQKQDLIMEVQEEQNYTAENKRKRKAYDNAFKLTVVQVAEKESNHAAARKFGVSEKNVRYWRKAKKILQEAPKTKKKNVSIPKDLHMIEDDLNKWFLYYQEKGSVLNKKTVMMKAKALAKEAKYKIDTNRYRFGSSWCDRFMRTFGLLPSQKKKSTVGAGTQSHNTTDVLSESGSIECDDDLSVDANDVKLSDDEQVDSSDENMNSNQKENHDMFAEDNKLSTEIELKVEVDAQQDSLESEKKVKNLDLNLGCTETATESRTDKSVLSSNVQSRAKSFDRNDQTEDLIRKDKKRKHSSYDNSFKLQVVKYANAFSMEAAAQEFGVSENLVYEWCQSSHELEPRNKRKCSIPADLEEELVTWIKDMQRSGSNITAKLVACRARFLCDEGKYNIDSAEFKFSHGWFNGLMLQHGLSVHTKKEFAERSDADNSTENLAKDLPPELLGIPDQEKSRSDLNVDGKTKRQSYNNAFKSNVISFAESSSNDLAVKVFSVNEKNVRAWRKSKDVILNGPKHKKRHVVRPPPFEELEKDLKSWCHNVPKNEEGLSRAALKMKARQLAKTGKYTVDTSQFKASDSWCQKFLNRYGFTAYDGRSREGKSKQNKLSTEAGDTAHEDICTPKSAS